MVLVKLTDFFTTVIWLALDFYYDRNFTRQHNRQLSLLPHFAILCTRSTWGKFMRLKVEASSLSGRPPSCASAGANEGQESGSLQESLHESHFRKGYCGLDVEATRNTERVCIGTTSTRGGGCSWCCVIKHFHLMNEAEMHS